MTSMKKMNLGILAVALLAFGAVLAFNRPQDDAPAGEQAVVAENESLKPTENQTPPNVQVGDKALLSVPFVAQAPNANWDDPRQQDGCEEASLIMAYAWTQGQTSINKNEAEKTIIAMSEFEKEQYGNYLDLNAQDTAKLMKDYYNYSNTRVQLNVTIEDIKKELSAGNLVIVPANGKRLNNPNFSSGGPVTHMLIIKGYDDAKKQVITNDPGTRNGNGYVYSYTTLMNAMVNYPSGYHEDQTGQPNAMIVVMK